MLCASFYAIHFFLFNFWRKEDTHVMIDNDIIKQGLIFRFLQMSFARSLLVYRKIAYVRLQYFLHLPHRHIFDLATPVLRHSLLCCTIAMILWSLKWHGKGDLQTRQRAVLWCYAFLIVFRRKMVQACNSIKMAFFKLRIIYHKMWCRYIACRVFANLD